MKQWTVLFAVLLMLTAGCIQGHGNRPDPTTAPKTPTESQPAPPDGPRQASGSTVWHFGTPPELIQSANASSALRIPLPNGHEYQAEVPGTASWTLAADRLQMFNGTVVLWIDVEGIVVPEADTFDNNCFWTVFFTSQPAPPLGAPPDTNLARPTTVQGCANEPGDVRDRVPLTAGIRRVDLNLSLAPLRDELIHGDPIQVYIWYHGDKAPGAQIDLLTRSTDYDSFLSVGTVPPKSAS